MRHILGLLLLISALPVFAADEWYSELEPIERRSPVAKRFELLRRTDHARAWFVSHRDGRAGFLFYPDGRVVGFHSLRWFDFRSVPIIDGSGPNEEVVWSSEADRIELRVQHCLEKVYNPRWQLLGQLIDLGSGRGLDHFLVQRNPAFVDLDQANRALTNEYVMYSSMGEDDLAESLLDVHHPVAMAEKFGRGTEIVDACEAILAGKHPTLRSRLN